MIPASTPIPLTKLDGTLTHTSPTRTATVAQNPPPDATSTVVVTPLPSSSPGPSPTAAPCVAGDTGWISPTNEVADSGGAGDGFELNPAEAFGDGGGWATDTDGAGERHIYFDYGIDTANCGSISGIEVRMDWWLDNLAGTNGLAVELSWDGGTSWTPPYLDSVESLSERTVIVGGALDDWGHSWLVADSVDGTFMVRVTAISDSLPHSFNLDWIPIRAHYTP